MLWRSGHALSNYRFLRRPFLGADFPFFLPIRKSSRFLPPLIASRIHTGGIPRPAHVSPPGPRYFGAIFRPSILFWLGVLRPVSSKSWPTDASCSLRILALLARAA